MNYPRWKDDACPHARVEVRDRVLRDGSHRNQRQCLDCGDSVGDAIARSVLKTAVPAWDAEALKRRQGRHQANVEDERTAWWRWYADYLQTPAWRARRERVLVRDPTCQGCGVRPSIIAHHTTYTRVGCEMLFDLIGVCAPCHDVIHGQHVPPSFTGAGSWALGMN